MPLDPTKTTNLRRRFIRQMRKRFANLKADVRHLIETLDAFGLEDREPFTFNVEPREFAFQTSAQKLDTFRRWLQQQVDQRILVTDSITGEPWTGEFIDSAYRRGATNAFVSARKGALKEGLDFFEGSKEEFLRGAFSQPETLSKVQLLATRTFEELRGVTATMAQQLNRELASGIANGLNPRQVARGMAARIDGLSKRRAEVIARTEIIHAHAEGQLDSFEKLGVEEVGIQAEWLTAGDDRVCVSCAAREGQLFTIKEARGEIPLHPNCRCSWIPAV